MRILSDAGWLSLILAVNAYLFWCSLIYESHWLIRVMLGGIVLGTLWNAVVASRTSSRLVRVGSDGLGFKARNRRWVELRWAEIRCFEFPRRRSAQNLGSSGFVTISDGRGDSRTYKLPLNYMNKTTSERFVEALREYWPDERESRHDQPETSNGLDSANG
ncbi:MAG: hypothetical protein AAF408_07195 [Pseudomonadota bacterium]